MNNKSITVIKQFPKSILREINNSLTVKMNSPLYVFKQFSNRNIGPAVKGVHILNRSYSCACKPFSQKDVLLSKVVLHEPSFTDQRRNFSLKESYESALTTHTTVFNWLSESTGVKYTQNFVVYIHDTTGFPWWLSIILTTFLVRSVVTFPLALYQHYVIARFQNVRIEMDDIVNNIKYELNREVRRNKWPEKKARLYYRAAVRKEYTRLIERDNCHPVKSVILAIFQIPLWVVFSTSFRNLVYMLPHADTFAELKRLELSVGGVAWFPDLTIPDSFIIPIMLGLVNLTIMEVQEVMHPGPRSRTQKYFSYFFRGFCIFMIPVSACIPSCITFYWLSSCIFGLGQNLLILSPRIRRSIGIPLTPTTSSHPYKQLVEQIKGRFRI